MPYGPGLLGSPNSVAVYSPPCGPVHWMSAGRVKGMCVGSGGGPCAEPRRHRFAVRATAKDSFGIECMVRSLALCYGGIIGKEGANGNRARQHSPERDFSSSSSPSPSIAAYQSSRPLRNFGQRLHSPCILLRSPAAVQSLRVSACSLH